MTQQIILMDKKRISRTLKRLAFQVWETLSDDQELIIIGLNERGFATAKILVEHLAHLSDTTIELHPFNVLNAGVNTPLPNCSEKHVLIVDDVIFSGKTMFDALSLICNSNNPSKIEVLTLVDRGHRTYPILSGLTGIEVPNKLGEHIEVLLNLGVLEQVVLFKNS